MGQQLPTTNNPILQTNKQDMFESTHVQRIKDTPFIDAQLYTARPLLFVEPLGPSLLQLTSPRLGTQQLFPQEEILNIIDCVVTALNELADNGFRGHGDLSMETIHYQQKSKIFKLTHPAFND